MTTSAPDLSAASAASPILVVDVARLLDESAAGLAASATLQARFDAAKAQFENLRDKGATTAARHDAEEAAAAFQQEAITEIERERASLGQGAVEAILPVLEAVRAERGASVVLDPRQVLASAGAVDVTELVLQRLSTAV